jgi:hypothetical protein
VDENGAAAGYSANVREMSYVNGTVWQENGSGLWWSWSGTAWAGGNGTATSPLATSASDMVISPTSASAVVDADGNSWAITSDGTVYEDGAAAGYSANVTQLAYVGGVIWQENASNLWWSWTGTGWSSQDSATSPLSSS